MSASHWGWAPDHPLRSVPADLAAENRELHRLRELVDWLISMDDPEDVDGLEQRRTVRLSAIIDRARDARGAA